MIVTVFRTRLNPQVEDAYGPVATRMSELARSVPGYVSHKGFVAEDGERVTIVEPILRKRFGNGRSILSTFRQRSSASQVFIANSVIKYAMSCTRAYGRASSTKIARERWASQVGVSLDLS